MTREQLLARLQPNSIFDLVVIGGGATGLGVALDACLRGFSVLLLESHDFAGGSSSRSTKLLHGGIRYLAQGNVHLVKEALHERMIVLKNAPHLAQPLAFVMPSYQWWQTPFYGLVLKLYALLAGRAGLGATRCLSAAQTQRALPNIQTRGLKGGVLYWDAQFDDARLALALARSVEREGGTPLNYMAVTRVRAIQASTGSAATTTNPRRPRFELQVQDQRLGADYAIQAHAVVNAAGVWVDAVRNQALTDSAKPIPEPIVSPSQGVHLVVSRELMPASHALLVPKTQDGRVLFIVPWLGSLILGTTDTPRHDLPREPQAFESEIAFILSEASKVLSRTVTRSDVKSLWVGLRPLVATQHKQGKSLSREHTIVHDNNGLMTVTGGKWTTYRAMAQDVLNACFDADVLPMRRLERTPDYALVGANPHAPTTPIFQAPGAHLYGDQWAQVEQCAGSSHHLGLGLSEAMVRFAVQHEYALTVEDVLARRWRVLFLDARLAIAMAPAVAAIMQCALQQASPNNCDPQLQAFLDLAAHYILP